MIFNSELFDNHEQIVFCNDSESGLRAIIAIHSTVLGPALGGCRMLPYPAEQDALNDVLKLSKAMSYKAAMAGLKQTGGKAVILGDPLRDKTPELLHAFANMVDRLGGRYLTSIDSGTNVRDMDVIRQKTEHVAGTSVGSGDPSKATAWGVFQGIKAAIEYKYGSSNFKNLKVAVQGVGHVGEHLCHFLSEAGAQLIIADLNHEIATQVANLFDAKHVSHHDITAADCNVFAPCALGGILNKQSVKELNCDIVAGAANNQLAREDIGVDLAALNILYIPDYIINSGGIIDLMYERQKTNYDQSDVFSHCANIYNTVGKVLERAELENLPTNIAADVMAEEILTLESEKKYFCNAKE